MIKRIHRCALPPAFYGLAYVDGSAPEESRHVCLVMPLNVIVGWAIWIYWHFKGGVAQHFMHEHLQVHAIRERASREMEIERCKAIMRGEFMIFGNLISEEAKEKMAEEARKRLKELGVPLDDLLPPKKGDAAHG